MKYNKEDIEHLLYDCDLDLNKIIDIKKNLNESNISLDDREYLEELLNDELDVIDDLNELKKLRQTFIENNFDISYIDKLIKRKNPISDDDIDLLNKEDLEYYIYDGSIYLDLDGLLRVKYNSNKYDYSEFDLNTLDSEINEKIECILDISELENYKAIMKNYGFNTDFIEKRIYNKKHGIVEESTDPLFIELDNYIASMPREVLNKVREDSIANNEDTEIIDRALKIKDDSERELNEMTKKIAEMTKKIEQEKDDSQRKLNEMTKEIEEKTRKIEQDEINYAYDKQHRDSKSSISLFDVIAGLTLSSLLTSKDKKRTESNDYESWNFEEEELEEDDYYYEDDE